jgi:hypothetical protein
MEGTTWAVVQGLGLVVSRPEPGQCLVYGSSDPLPNPAELMLTQLVASRYKLSWNFFVYLNGNNLPIMLNQKVVDYRFLRPNSENVFNLESIIPKELTLGELAKEIWRLRQEPTIIAHLSNGFKIRATSDPHKKWPSAASSKTIHQLHKTNGWLGGSAIHFILRLWAEERHDILYICPFQKKGRVYDIYRGFKRPLFILVPFLRFVPPLKLGLPDWAPAPWLYWLSLPAFYRKKVRMEVMRRLFSGECRIEIQLP